MQHVLGPSPVSTYGDRGYTTELGTVDPVALALRFCSCGADTLAARMRAVPEEYVHGKWVACVCGMGNMRRRMFECAGDSCSRWFFCDDDGVYAARLDS